MSLLSKKQADAHDRILNAAEALAALIESSGILVAEEDVEELSVFLARNGPKLKTVLSGIRKKVSDPADLSETENKHRKTV